MPSPPPVIHHSVLFGGIKSSLSQKREDEYVGVWGFFNDSSRHLQCSGLLAPSVMCVSVKGDVWAALRRSKFRQEHCKLVMRALFAQFPSKLLCIIQ